MVTHAGPATQEMENNQATTPNASTPPEESGTSCVGISPTSRKSLALDSAGIEREMLSKSTSGRSSTSPSRDQQEILPEDSASNELRRSSAQSGDANGVEGVSPGGSMHPSAQSHGNWQMVLYRGPRDRARSEDSVVENRERSYSPARIDYDSVDSYGDRRDRARRWSDEGSDRAPRGRSSLRQNLKIFIRDRSQGQVFPNPKSNDHIAPSARKGTDLSSLRGEISHDDTDEAKAPAILQRIRRLFLKSSYARESSRSDLEKAKKLADEFANRSHLTSKSAYMLWYMAYEYGDSHYGIDVVRRLRDALLFFYQAPPADYTLRNLLEAIDRSGIAFQPDGDPALGQICRALGWMLEAMNVWQDPSLKYTKTGIDRDANVNSTLFFEPSTFRASSAGSFDTARARQLTSFSADDLDIATLQDLGNISIEWTFRADDHLKLTTYGDVRDDASASDTRDGGLQSATLRVYWFDALEISWLGKHLNEHFEDDTAELISLEIIRTWSFLFHHSKKSKDRRAYSAYSDLRVPYSVAQFLKETTGKDDLHLRSMADILELGLEQHLYDVQQHLHPHLRIYNRQQHGQYAYKNFPNFDHRIAKLRRHMDLRKPRGLRQLWKDNRDSLNYFTFWAVIFFGLASVLLALLSLITGIIQAWASVKALNQGS